MKFIEPTTIPFTKEFKGVSPTSKPRWYYTFTCPECSIVTTKVKANNFKWLCNSCAHITSSTEEFIRKAKQKFGNLYDYSKTYVHSTRTKVTITCPTHGDFSVRVMDHLRPNTLNGCPTCGRMQHNHKVTKPLADWETTLQQKHAGKFTIVSYDSVGYHAPVQFLCPNHGEFTSTFGAITSSKYLCRNCANHSHQKQSKRCTSPFGKLYYAYIPSIDMYKLGVTSHKSSSLATTKHALLWEKWFSYEDAIAIEHILHTELASFRYTGTKKLLRAGNTELYKINVEQYIFDILSRASQRELCVERILNGEPPYLDNSVLNQDTVLVNAERLSLQCE